MAEGKREKDRQPEEQRGKEGEERAHLRGRAEWFRMQRVYPGEDLPGDALQRARDQREQLRERDSAEDIRPGPIDDDRDDDEDEPHYRIQGRGDLKIDRQENPAPGGSFGYAGETFEILGEFEEATLSLPVDAKLAEGRLDPSSLRLFRWDKEYDRFRKVRGSGPGPNNRVIGRITEPGIYTTVGIPTDPYTRMTIDMIGHLCPWLRSEPRLQAELQDRICQFILCPGPGLGEMLGDEQFMDEHGLPVYPGEYGGDLCERCTGIRFPEGEIGGGCLPEEEILGEREANCTIWQTLGPWNINGRVRAMAIHPRNGDIVYAGASNGGVWVSTDAGGTWRALMHDEPSLSIGALAVHRNAMGRTTIYAGTGEPTSWPGYAGVGVLKSVDGGLNWAMTGPFPTASGNPPRGFAAIVVDPGNTNIVYAAAYSGGLYRSDDGGVTWTLLRGGNYRDLIMDPNDSQVLYAGQSFTGLVKSTDGGATWTVLGGGLPAPPLIIRVAVSAADSNIVYAKFDRTVLRSDDGGATWTDLGDHGGGTYGYWCSHLHVDPTDPDIVYAAGVSMERSDDGGATWTSIPGGSNWQVDRLHPDQHDLVFDPNDPAVIYASNDGGVYRSSNRGDNWAKRSDGLVITEFYDIGIGPGWPILVGGGTQDNGTLKTNGSLYWDFIQGADGGHFVVDQTDSNIIYAETQNLGLTKSTNGGASFSGATNGIDPSDPKPWVGIIAIDPSHPIADPANNRVLFTGTNRVYKTTDGAANWNAVSPVLDGGLVSAIAIADSDPNTVYVGTSSGGVFKTTDGGATWSADISSPTMPGRFVSRIVAQRNNANMVYVTYSGFGSATPATPEHVFHSQDGGITWASIDGTTPATSLPDIPITSIVIDRYDPDFLYIASDVGTFRTINRGLTWAPFDDGLPNCIVTDLALDRDENSLRASTFGRGMYRREL